MKLKVGEVDPIITVDMGIDISKFNKAQLVKVIKERDQYKGLYEELLKRGGQPVPQIHDGSQWKKKCEEVQLENKKLKRQMQSVRAETTFVLLTK